MIRILAVLIIPAFIAFGPIIVDSNSGSKTVLQNDGWQTFDDAEFSIEYPADWDLDSTGLMGTSFVLFAAPATSTDNFRENINLVIQDLTGLDLGLDEFVAISESQVQTMVTNSTILESSRLIANNEECHKIIYTGDQGMFNLKWKQYYWVRGTNAYVLTFTGGQSTYDSHIKIADQILDSFKMKN